MIMEKVILYYKFVPVSEPEVVRLWQKALCEKLNLKGRIIISEHGINGTLGGDSENLKSYIAETKTYAPFKKTSFKWSDGNGHSFPKLSIKVRDEIVTFNALDEISVDESGIIGGGKHIKPKELKKLIKERGDNVVFFDGRNAYESAVGAFKDAVTPNIRTSKDFGNELDKPEYEPLKDKTVVTYCTGGVRCEVLSVLMKNRGFKDVYQLDGGIVTYGSLFKDEDLWEGSLFVFDDRMVVKFSDDAVDIGKCTLCQSLTSRYINCANKACNELILVCENCNANIYCKNEVLALKLLD
jgi:UPF0176 protein